MGQMDQKWDRIMGFFFNYPHLTVTLRQLAAKVKVPKSTLQRELRELAKEKLILKVSPPPFPGYKANETDFWYKFHKKDFLIRQIYGSGLVDFLEDRVRPAVILLFGSGAKGEYNSESDIDLFVLTSSEKEVNLEKYEKKLKHKINLLIKENYASLSPELFNNLINGYKLYGYIKLR